MNNIKEIPIWNDDKIIDYAIVDHDDYDKLSKYKWKFTKYGYVTNGKYKSGFHLMHRIILGLSPNDGKITDHKNRIRKDNRKNNLRICTRAENAQNANKRRDKSRSKYKGVKLQYNGLWITWINVNKKRICGGTFETEIMAAKRYDQLARQYHKDFAALNFPDSDDYTDINMYIKDNHMKSSQYFGVTKVKNRWRAFIAIKGSKAKHIGSYLTEIEAALARDKYCQANQINVELNFSE